VLTVAVSRQRHPYFCSTYVSSAFEIRCKKVPYKLTFDVLLLVVKEREKDVKELENQRTSSLVWIAVAGHNCSEVNVVDANSPGDVLDTFYICSSRVLCIASVPGDYHHSIVSIT